MIAILGGGISGLALAHQLKKQQKAFIIIEAQQWGGKIQSIQENGFTYELGPNTVLINNKAIKSILDDLQLSAEIIQPYEQAVKNRFVLKNGNIEAIPNSFSSAWKSKLFKASTLASILKEPFKKAKNGEADESLADFSRRRFGTQIYEDFITPFVSGIYAGDPEKMSINHTLAILKNAELKHGSVLKGMPKIMKAKKQLNEADQLPKQKIFTFKNGLQKLIDALVNALNDKEKIIALVNQIEKVENGYSLLINDGNNEQKLFATQVVSTIPAFQLAKICQSISPSLNKALNQINYVPAVVTHWAFPKENMGFRKAAFGILSRRDEKVPFLGVLFNSRFFPHQAPANQELITVISGGYKQRKILSQTDNQILEEVEQSLRKLLKIKGEPSLKRLQRWDKGIPQYEIGHQELLNEINSFESLNSGFHIQGNFRGGISVSDCIQKSVELARKL